MDLYIARDKSYISERFFEIPEFLVGQCFDRRCIYGTEKRVSGHLRSEQTLLQRYTNRVMCFAARAIAYSATTVLPAEVCAATNTLSLCSK